MVTLVNLRSRAYSWTKSMVVDRVASDDRSINSSYADLFEASGIVIRDCEGSSFSQGPLITNIVTYNLNKCKKQVIVPYYKLLCFIAWRPFGKEIHSSKWWLVLLNFIYCLICFCILIFWYVIRVLTCQGRLVIDDPPTTIVPRTLGPTVNPNVSAVNWTTMIPALIPEKNVSNEIRLFMDPCQHIFGSYIVPNILHFMAFLTGFYHFRMADREGFFALMEKVYLQSNSPQQKTKALRHLLYAGYAWLFICLLTMIHYFFVFGLSAGTGISKEHPYLQYSVAVLILLSNVFANSVNVAVVLSWGGQCMLLSCYIDGVKERLEEKSTELKAAMRDILDIKRHFSRLNGILSISISCIVFDLVITFVICVVLLFNFNEMIPIIWTYRLSCALEWGAMLAYILIQAAVLTSKQKVLVRKALAIRVFGYQSHTQLDIDSFLNFLNMVTLEVEIFTIPVKPRYLFGVLIFSLQILILVFQTGMVIGKHKWL